MPSCSRCGKRRPPTYSYCRTCHREYGRAYYRDNIERQRELAKARAARYRARKRVSQGVATPVREV